MIWRKKISGCSMITTITLALCAHLCRCVRACVRRACGYIYVYDVCMSTRRCVWTRTPAAVTRVNQMRWCSAQPPDSVSRAAIRHQSRHVIRWLTCFDIRCCTCFREYAHVVTIVHVKDDAFDMVNIQKAVESRSYIIIMIITVSASSSLYLEFQLLLRTDSLLYMKFLSSTLQWISLWCCWICVCPVMNGMSAEEYRTVYWPKLELAIDQLLTQSPLEHISISYEQIYRCVPSRVRVCKCDVCVLSQTSVVVFSVTCISVCVSSILNCCTMTCCGKSRVIWKESPQSFRSAHSTENHAKIHHVCVKCIHAIFWDVSWRPVHRSVSLRTLTLLWHGTQPPCTALFQFSSIWYKCVFLLQFLLKVLCSNVVTMFSSRTSSTLRQSWTGTWGMISWSSSQIMWQRNTSTRYYVSTNPFIITCPWKLESLVFCELHHPRENLFCTYIEVFLYFLSTSSERSFHAISSQTINNGECGERSLQPQTGWDLLNVTCHALCFRAMFFLSVYFCPQTGFLSPRLCFLDSFLRFILPLLNLSSRFTLLKTKNCSWSCRRTVSAGNAVNQ